MEENNKKDPKEGPKQQPVSPVAPPEAPAKSGDPQIDAIREIIFGQNIRQYNEQFDHISVEIDKLRQEILAKIEQTRTELDAMIGDLREDTYQKLTQLRDHTDQEVARLDHAKTDRNMLGTLLVEIGEKIRKDA